MNVVVVTGYKHSYVTKCCGGDWLAELAPSVFSESKILSLFMKTEAGGLNQAAVIHASLSSQM